MYLSLDDKPRGEGRGKKKHTFVQGVNQYITKNLSGAPGPRPPGFSQDVARCYGANNNRYKPLVAVDTFFAQIALLFCPST